MIETTTLKPGDYICFNNLAGLLNDSLRWQPLELIKVNAAFVTYLIPEKNKFRQHSTHVEDFHRLSHASCKNAAYKGLLKR
jgi:hypothetical protein